MAIQKFWMIFGSLFAVGVVLLFLVKNFSEGFAGNKKPMLFGTLSATGISGGAFLSTWITEHLFTLYWIFSAIFLLFGILHLVFFHKKYFYSNNNNRGRVFFGEILFGLSLVLFTVVIFSSLQFFVKDKGFMFFPMLMSLLCFFIPMLFYYTFEAAYKIPLPVFSTWQYPVHAPIDLPDERPGEKILVIAFEIAKKDSDNVKTNFRAKGPDTMHLGDLYYHFINDYNEFHSETTIDYTDQVGQPYDWWFRVKPKWYQFNRVLDPDETIRDNKIKENTIIVCERIKHQEDY